MERGVRILICSQMLLRVLGPYFKNPGSSPGCSHIEHTRSKLLFP
jgi:hypothetical protein